MEALSFRFELGNKPTRNKKFSIYLCITVGGKRKRIKSPVEVPSRNDFNSKCIGDNWVRKSVPQSTRWNKLLHDFKEEAVSKFNELDLEEGSLIWHTRNYFLFSFYCAGIRAGDLIQLRWKNIVDGRLNYQMGKNHKMRDLVLVQPALDILAYYRYGKEKIRKRDYVFPLLDPKKAYFSYVDQKGIDAMPVEIKQLLHKDVSSKNVVMNKELRRIAKLAGIDKEISMHVSRHSFAKIAKDQGTDNSAIQQMLAHSSLKVTEGYMGSFDTKSTDNALMNIFGKTVTKKDTMITEVMSLLQERDEKYVAELLAKLQSESKFHIDD